MFTQCEADTSQECVEDCDTSGYAIFCDGQFVASAGDLDACAAEIEEAFDIHLEFAAEGSVAGFFGCSIDPNSNPTSPFGLMACLGGLLWLRSRVRPASR